MKKQIFQANNGLNPPISMQKDWQNEGMNPPKTTQPDIKRRGLNPLQPVQPKPQTQNPQK